jgi:hypothetical protein
MLSLMGDKERNYRMAHAKMTSFRDTRTSSANYWQTWYKKRMIITL